MRRGRSERLLWECSGGEVWKRRAQRIVRLLVVPRWFAQGVLRENLIGVGAVAVLRRDELLRENGLIEGAWLLAELEWLRGFELLQDIFKQQLLKARSTMKYRWECLSRNRLRGHVEEGRFREMAPDGSKGKSLDGGNVGGTLPLEWLLVVARVIRLEERPRVRDGSGRRRSEAKCLIEQGVG